MGLSNNLSAAVVAGAVALGAGPNQDSNKDFSEFSTPTRAVDRTQFLREQEASGHAVGPTNQQETLAQVGVPAGLSVRPWAGGLIGPVSGTTVPDTAKLFGTMMALEPADGTLHQMYRTVYGMFEGKFTATTDKLEALSKDLLTSPEAKEKMLNLIKAEIVRVGGMMINPITQLSAIKASEQLMDLKRSVGETLQTTAQIQKEAEIFFPAGGEDRRISDLQSGIRELSTTLGALELQSASAVIQANLEAERKQTEALIASIQKGNHNAAKASSKDSLNPAK